MAYMATDLSAVEAAILELAKGKRAVSVTVEGKSIEFAQAGIDKLRALRA